MTYFDALAAMEVLTRYKWQNSWLHMVLVSLCVSTRMALRGGVLGTMKKPDFVTKTEKETDLKYYEIKHAGEKTYDNKNNELKADNDYRVEQFFYDIKINGTFVNMYKILDDYYQIYNSNGTNLILKPECDDKEPFSEDALSAKPHNQQFSIVFSILSGQLIRVRPHSCRSIFKQRAKNINLPDCLYAKNTNTSYKSNNDARYYKDKHLCNRILFNTISYINTKTLPDICEYGMRNNIEWIKKKPNWLKLGLYLFLFHTIIYIYMYIVYIYIGSQ